MNFFTMSSSLTMILGTFRSEDEDDYEYEFSVLNMRIRFGGRHFSKCACSEQKTRTRSRPRPPICDCDSIFIPTSFSPKFCLFHSFSALKPFILSWIAFPSCFDVIGTLLVQRFIFQSIWFNNVIGRVMVFAAEFVLPRTCSSSNTRQALTYASVCFSP